ncbi:hypothetical protein AB1Y20_022553 [Prymnesium parvum]|uniref:FHA domain-containing protein n=1 Tax=Prymnesium parvum TaxID=97485 RepID=A0AB34JJV8_PRYPA
MWRLEWCDGVAHLPVAAHPPVYSVGRKQESDLLLTDMTVSRTHAELELRDASLLLRHVSSRAGATAVNGKPLDGGALRLQDGDQLTFGKTNVTVAHAPLVLRFSSRFSGGEKAKMMAEAAAAGAQVRTGAAWTEDVTHLVLARFALTPKLFLALARAIPVVTPAWLAALAARRGAMDPLPEPREFLPPGQSEEMHENPLPPDCALPQLSRKTLFAGWRLVWLPHSKAEASAETECTTELLKCMGAAVEEWGGGGADGAVDEAVAQAHLSRGASFLRPDRLAASAAVLALQRMGGLVYDASKARICLLRNDLVKMTPLAAETPRLAQRAERSPSLAASPAAMPLAAATPAAAAPAAATTPLAAERSASRPSSGAARPSLAAAASKLPPPEAEASLGGWRKRRTALAEWMNVDEGQQEAPKDAAAVELPTAQPGEGKRFFKKPPIRSHPVVMVEMEHAVSERNAAAQEEDADDDAPDDSGISFEDATSNTKKRPRQQLTMHAFMAKS